MKIAKIFLTNFFHSVKKELLVIAMDLNGQRVFSFYYYLYLKAIHPCA